MILRRLYSFLAVCTTQKSQISDHKKSGLTPLFLIQFGKFLRLIFGYQRVNNFTQSIAGDDFVQLV